MSMYQSRNFLIMFSFYVTSITFINTLVCKLFMFSFYVIDVALIMFFVTLICKPYIKLVVMLTFFLLIFC